MEEKLNKENEHLKLENSDLKNENQLLKNEIKKLKKEKEGFKIALDKLNLIRDEEIKKLDEKYKKLDDKMKIIDDLILKMKRNIVGQKTNNSSVQCGEKNITINLVSFDQRINHSIICKNNTNFQDIEKELYLKYPEYAKNYSCLIYNGLSINKFKTLEQNGIHGYTIILNKIDNK